MHKSNDAGLIGALVTARRALKLSQSALAQSLSMPQSYVSRLESGQIDLRLSSLIGFARFFNLEVILVPTAFVPVVRSIISSDSDTTYDAPLYRLEDIEQDED